VHLLELINLRFFHFLKREKKIGGWIFWMRDGGVEENIFFSLNKRNVSEYSIFFPALLISVFFLFFFANVQKVSISRRLVVKFLLGHCKFRTDLVRAQTFQKGAVLFYYMLLMLFMGKHILPLKRYYFVSYYIFKCRSCTSFPRKAWKEWNPHRPRGRKARSSSP